MDGQIVIKFVLVAAFSVFAFILIVPAKGARKTAVRRLLLVFVFAAVVATIMFPQLLSGLATVMGVGRGVDLVLYTLVVLFIGNAIAQSAQNRQLQGELTAVARAVAISQAPDHLR
jgi:hypothetical protein